MEKKSKKGIIIGITSLFLVMLILVGLTYAYYRTRIIGNDSNQPSISVTSKVLGVAYEDGEAVLSTPGKINPGFNATKTFYVENTGEEQAEFSILLDSVNNTFKRKDWSYTLTREDTNEVLSEGVLPSTDAYLVLSTSLNSKEKGTYKLTINYAELKNVDQSIDMKAVLSFRVNIADATEITYENAPANTLLYAIRNNQPNGTATTIPGESDSLANEARLLETEDDNGTSYVYRGNVTNNYVTYSNMCWRIVRVQGDKTIKLALADWEHPCGIKNGYNPEDGDSALIADAEGNVKIDIKFNDKEGDISNALFENSIIVDELNSWANRVNLDTSQLTTADWCTDLSVHSSTTVEEWGFTQYHSAYKRTAPTLKCDMTGIEVNGVVTKAQTFTNLYGMLTADEIKFAGNAKNNNYLSVNASALASNPGYYNEIWTLTPANSSYVPINNVIQWGSVCMYSISLGNGLADSTQYVTFNGSEPGLVRPVIVLKKDVTLDASVKGQTGEMNTPYVIG